MPRFRSPSPTTAFTTALVVAVAVLWTPALSPHAMCMAAPCCVVHSGAAFEARPAQPAARIAGAWVAIATPHPLVPIDRAAPLHMQLASPAPALYILFADLRI